MIKTSGKGLKVTTALKDYTDKRFSRLLGQVPEDDLTLHVVLGLEGNRKQVRVHAARQGKTYDAHAEGNDMYATIDAAHHKLRRLMADVHAEKNGPARHRNTPEQSNSGK